MQPSVAAAHSVMVSTHTFGSGLHDRLGRIWRSVPICRRSVSVHLRQRGFIIVNEDDTGSCLTHKAARNASPNVDSAVSKRLFVFARFAYSSLTSPYIHFRVP